MDTELSHCPSRKRKADETDDNAKQPDNASSVGGASTNFNPSLFDLDSERASTAGSVYHMRSLSWKKKPRLETKG